MFETLKSRMEHGMTRRPGARKSELATACGVSKPSVTAWFSGETKALKGDTLVKAAAFFGVHARWLGGEGGPIELENPYSREPLKACEPDQPVSISRARARSLLESLSEDELPDIIKYMEWTRARRGRNTSTPPAQANGR